MASANGQRKGVWEPLPLIVYGYAIHPLSPSRRDTRLSRGRLSVVTEDSRDESLVHRDIVSLEVGDNIYAFERYIPRGKEVEGIWYRGYFQSSYVVCTARRPPVSWSTSTDPSSSRPPPKVEEPQQVFIGIFPASHIHIRDEVSDVSLADVATSINGVSMGSTAELGHPWSPPMKFSRIPDSLKDEGDESDTATTKKSFRLGPPPDQANSSRAGLTVYPTSLRSSSPADSQVAKPLPPRPSLKSGDDTASGAEQPIIDEIASALREWHNLMFQYLARRDYKLFHMVREHIEALHLGRRQLLARTLNAEETVNMRRECVTRLVSGNVVQGLDIIVRHPTWGGLVTVDVAGDSDSRSWVSAVRMYAMQISLAYMNVPHDHTKLSAPPSHGSRTDTSTLGPVPTPAHSAFPDLPRHKSHKASSTSISQSPSAKFYHVFLDVGAFVASPCAPGETAELYFSLFSRARNKFITEDFCAILNHNGVLARSPTTRVRIRTLFTDLSQSDVQDPIYLVCRIVRAGAMKMGSSGMLADNNEDTPPMSPLPTSGRRASNELGSYTRRPFGCAVLELTQLQLVAEEHLDSSPTKEHTMAIYVPTNEALFSMLHEDIIANNSKEFDKSPRAENVALSIKVFHGDASTIIRENTFLLQDIPLTLRLGFPDVVFPGDVRNEVYIKLWSGEFGSGHGGSRLSVPNFPRVQASSSNYQVTVEVRDSTGRNVGNVISQGSGEPLTSQFHSVVFQRCNQPTYGELIKIKLPTESIPDWHLFFTFRNRSGRDKNSRSITADSSDRPFAFAFQPLFPENRAFVEDGSRVLILFRADRISQVPPELYLAAPSCILGGQRLEQLTIHSELMRLAPPIRDTFTIRSSLCSTRFTHNAVLLSLMNWEQVGDKEHLSTVLSKFTFVGEVEIVKFLRDIFDALFAIMVSQNNQSGEIDHLVFNALVTVLGIVQDRRFSNFQPVLDVYIEKHFNCAAASTHMIHSMNRLLNNPEAASQLRATLKVWHYIFKFIARSRELQKSKEVGGGATAEHIESAFKRELRSHLTEVNRMMSATSPPSIIGTQTIALQRFTSILPELEKVFSIVELVTIATTFANAVTATKGKITIWKLIMYLQIVKGFLFDNTLARPLLVEAVVIWIKPHFGKFDEFAYSLTGDSEGARDAARVSWLESIRLCITIIALMLDKLQQSLVNPTITSDRNLLRKEQDNIDFLLQLLPRLLDSYVEFQSPAALKALEQARSTTVRAQIPVTFPESYPFSLIAFLPKAARAGYATTTQKEPDSFFSPGLGETSIVLLVIILSSPKKDIINFFESSLEIEGREKFVSLLSQVFRVSTSILDNEAFPKSWLNVNILAHKVLIKLMDAIATILEDSFIPPQDSDVVFDVDLWRDGFSVLLKLLSSDQLVIEEFSPQKRRAVWRLAGDIRGDGAATMLTLWQALGWSEPVSGENGSKYGGYQVYLSGLVGHVVNLCLSHHDQLRANAVQMLFSMILTEFAQSGHFNGIENELVTRLDSIFMSDSKGDDISRSFFIGHLRSLFDSADVDVRLRERVTAFLDDVDMFLELLLSVRALPDGEEFSDDRVIATLRLMNFLRRIGRDEIYIKYVHQLVNMHLQAQNYVEAALTLKLHSDLHEWDLTSFLAPMEDLGLPQQSQFHRKETLCLLILDYLGKGKAWEGAIDICKELAYQHGEITFNYNRLAEILRHQANLLEHIVTDQRFYPEYFRVGFYGDFPSAIRGKQFIYRGFEWEKFSAFCDRMLTKHRGAQLLRGIADPPVDIRFGEEQWIHCMPVLPEPNRSLAIFNNPDVPRAVRSYYEHSSINMFSTSRPVVKKTVDGEEELWQERVYFTTEEMFPTVLRRSEIVDVQLIEISPLESAITEVEQKTKELATLNVQYATLARTAQIISTNPLAMSLNSAVDTPVETGITAYRHTFFAPSYLARHPERNALVEKLRQTIEEHVRVLDACLKLHGSLCPPEFIPFHETLEKFFHKNFRDEIRSLAVDNQSDLNGPDPSLRSYTYNNSTYQPSLYDSALARSTSTTSTNRPPAFMIPPLQLGSSAMTSSLLSPTDDGNLSVSVDGGVIGGSGSLHTAGMGSGQDTSISSTLASKQTPLKRHLAHLARHGINGVSSAPGDTVNGSGGGGSDSLSMESTLGAVYGNPNSVTNGRNGASTSSNNVPTVHRSGASVATSNLASSLGSLKERFGRSLNFRKKGSAS